MRRNNKVLFLLFITFCSLLPALSSAQWLDTTITVGSGPLALVWNSQENKVYCVNAGDYPYYNNTMTVIDGQTDSVITTITTGSNPNTFCWNSLQNRVYAANQSSSSVSVIRDVMSGIEENRLPLIADRFPFEVYPNPAKTFFTIRLPQSANRSQIKMFDVSGKIVKELNFSGVGEIRVPLKDIKAGVYFVQLDNQTTTKKLIITK